MEKYSKLIIKQVNKPYDSDGALKNVLHYISRKEECRYWRAFGASRKNIQEVVTQFLAIQGNAGKASRKRIRQVIISFPLYMDDVNVAKIVAEAISEYIFEEYQVVYAVHEKIGNLHIHFAINPVSYMTGKKWHMSSVEFMEWKKCVLEIVNGCLRSNGYRNCEL